MVKWRPRRHANFAACGTLPMGGKGDRVFSISARFNQIRVRPCAVVLFQLEPVRQLLALEARGLRATRALPRKGRRKHAGENPAYRLYLLIQRH
jgi:hypothetical protein